MATIQQAIEKARAAGFSEAEIKKKVESIGGTYTAPVSTPKTSLSTPSGIGISGPEELVASSNLKKPGFLESVGNFFAPTTTANIKDIYASSKTGKYVQSQEAITKQLNDLAIKMRDARKRGDTATLQKLAAQSKALSGTGDTIEAPEFSQDTKDGTSYLLRGIKTGAELGSYLAPAGKTLGIAGKTGLAALGGGLKGFGSSQTGEELGSTVGGAVTGAVMGLAGQALKWTGKQISQKSVQATGANESKVIKKFGTSVNELASKYGKNVEELYGPIAEKGKGGTLSKASTEAEKIIQDTIKNAPKDTKISKDILINAFDKEISSQKEGLNKTIASGLEKAKKELIKQYGNDFTPDKALSLLREANKHYSESAIGSVEKNKFEIIRESLRKVIGETFPEIDDALKTESEIITLKPIIEREIGKVTSKTGQGIFNKGFDVTKPLTYPVIGPGIQSIGNKVIPGAVSTLGNVLESPLTQRAAESALTIPGGQGMEQVPTTEPTTGLETGGLVTPQTTETTPTGQEPILSPGGQWQWDEAQNDWVPYTAETGTQSTKQTLTGYSPEELYAGAVSAYQSGDTASYKQLMSMYNDETKYQKTAGSSKSTMTVSQKKELSDFDVSVKQLESLDKSLNQYKDIMGPIQGRVKSLNPYDTDTQAFNAKMTAVAQIVGKAMEGGVLRKEDTAKYAKMLPQITDTPAVAKRKLNNVVEMIKLQQQTKEDIYSGSENMGDQSITTQDLESYIE